MYEDLLVDEGVARRIAAIAALIESDKDGEVLAAARKLVRTLERHDLRIRDLILSALLPATDEDAIEGWWRAWAKICLEQEPKENFWSDRTRAFLCAMITWPKSPSHAQRVWLENCLSLIRDADVQGGCQ